jgi:predicted phosphodiesterase
MSRFGVLGDVHCEHEALAAALKLFEHQKVDRVLCVGDVVDGPGDAFFDWKPPAFTATAPLAIP